MQHWGQVLAGLVLGAGLAVAQNPATMDRPIGRQPVYQGSPAYGLIVFDAAAQQRLWLVHDGPRLFVDRNGNGDLTDDGEPIASAKPEADDEANSYTFRVNDVTLGGITHKGLTVYALPLRSQSSTNAPQADDGAPAEATTPAKPAYRYVVTIEALRPGLTGGATGGRVLYQAGPRDLVGNLCFATTPHEAPIVHLGRPLRLAFDRKAPLMWPGRGSEFSLVVGSPGVGPGTFAAVVYQDTIPQHAHPVVHVTFPTPPGEPPLIVKYELKERC